MAEYILGFKKFAERWPTTVGEPLENEWSAVPGLSQQRTTKGWLTYFNGRVVFTQYWGTLTLSERV